MLIFSDMVKLWCIRIHFPMLLSLILNDLPYQLEINRQHLCSDIKDQEINIVPVYPTKVVLVLLNLDLNKPIFVPSQVHNKRGYLNLTDLIIAC